MNVFVRAMVRIFSFGERWNVLYSTRLSSCHCTHSYHCTHKHSLSVYYHSRAGCIKKRLKLTVISGNANQPEPCILYLITIRLQNSD